MARTPSDVVTVLVVEDEYPIGRATVLLLEDEGYRAQLASNGADALALLRAGARFDVVVTDDSMPMLDGVELVRAMRADRDLADIPAILLASAGRALDDLPASIVSVIFKPFAASDLLLDLRAIAQGVRLLRGT